MNEYVKFITQAFVQHYNQPKEKRKQLKIQRKEYKQPFLTNWFGLIPYAFLSIFKRK